MIIHKAVFDVIVPLQCNSSEFMKIANLNNKKSITKQELLQLDSEQCAKSGLNWFQYCFSAKPLSRTLQLEDSPLLSDVNGGYIKRFDLNQAQREQIGLHKNENCIYQLVK